MSENAQSITAKRLLEALAEVNRLLRDHSAGLRRLSGVTAAQAFPLEAVFYTNGSRLEGCVEAALPDGDVVCWCLDVSWNQDFWVVEATLDRKSGNRQQTVRELPTATVGQFDSFLQELKRVTRE